MPRFHYGSHYSSAAHALFYLLRTEPYTALAKSMQGGAFDLPDRLFHSIESTWNLCFSHLADFKELIPEFYSGDGSFLVNKQHLDLGRRIHDSAVVDDVLLPPWANSPAHFVMVNRKALESDHVSDHLHLWIDLIFGTVHHRT
jgi:hypothetical protein